MKGLLFKIRGIVLEEKPLAKRAANCLAVIVSKGNTHFYMKSSERTLSIWDSFDPSLLF